MGLFSRKTKVPFEHMGGFLHHIYVGILAEDIQHLSEDNLHIDDREFLKELPYLGAFLMFLQIITVFPEELKEPIINQFVDAMEDNDQGTFVEGIRIYSKVWDASLRRRHTGDDSILGEPLVCVAQLAVGRTLGKDYRDDPLYYMRYSVKITAISKAFGEILRKIKII